MPFLTQWGLEQRILLKEEVDFQVDMEQEERDVTQQRQIEKEVRIATVSPVRTSCNVIQCSTPTLVW